jgi:hypothetical protein
MRRGAARRAPADPPARSLRIRAPRRATHRRYQKLARTGAAFENMKKTVKVPKSAKS